MWTVRRADLADKAVNRQNSQSIVNRPLYSIILVGPLKNTSGGGRINNFSVVDITVYKKIFQLMLRNAEISVKAKRDITRNYSN